MKHHIIDKYQLNVNLSDIYVFGKLFNTKK